MTPFLVAKSQNDIQTMKDQIRKWGCTEYMSIAGNKNRMNELFKSTYIFGLWHPRPRVHFSTTSRVCTYIVHKEWHNILQRRHNELANHSIEVYVRTFVQLLAEISQKVKVHWYSILYRSGLSDKLLIWNTNATTIVLGQPFGWTVLC